MALFFSFIAHQNNNEVWLRPQLNGNSESACKVFPSLKNINGILVRWVVSLDAAKSKQCLDASVSKIQNVLEHCFKAVFKLCLTDPCLSKVTYRQLTKNGELNLYTQQKLLCFGLFTRELYLFVYKSIHYDDGLHVRKLEKMHVITWRLLTLMDSTSLYGASCPTQEVAINFVFKWSQKSTISWTYLADYPVCKTTVFNAKIKIYAKRVSEI